MTNGRSLIQSNMQSIFRLSLGLILLPDLIYPVLALSAALPSEQTAIELAQQSDQENTSIIDTILQTFGRRRSRGEGIRRGEFCAVSPGLIETDRVWSDRPLFLWQGAVKQVNLRQLGNSQILWSQLITPDPQSGFQQIDYTGTALQPGEIYQWELVNESNRRTAYIFQVMQAEERDPLTAEWQTLSTQLQQQGATPPTIALRQAQFFADKGLWSDVLQSLSMSDSSLEATEAVQRLATEVCGSQQAPTPMPLGTPGQ
jgi:hypothetical protein